MNVLVTGANGNLGKIIIAELSAKGIDAIGASSHPKSGQRGFDLDFSIPDAMLANIDTVIHCARGNNYEQLANDLDFIALCARNKVRVVYIGSFSSWLLDRNQYGNYKRTVEDQTLEIGGIVITCGLLFGSGYQGQIYKIGLILRFLPFGIKFEGAGSQRITPLKALLEEIILNSLITPKTGRVILAYDAILNFNEILSAVGPRRFFSIQLKRNFLELLLGGIGNRAGYFNSDSLKGIYSKYSKSFAIDSEDKAETISKDYAEKFVNLV